MLKYGRGRGRGSGGHVPSVKLPDLRLRSQPLVMESCSSEETSAAPAVSCLGRANFKLGEVAQLLRCRGVFPALQLEWEKSRRAQEWPLPAMEVVGPGGSRFSGSPAVRPPLQANAVAVAQPLAFPRRLLLPSHKLTSSLHGNHLQQTAGFPHLLTLTFSASLLDMSLSFPR